MFQPALVCNSISNAPTVAFPKPYFFRFTTRVHLRQLQVFVGDRSPKSAVVSDSLKLLEWDKVCDSVSSFAGTTLGREATKAQLWSVDLSYEESKKLLAETTAAIEMINYGAAGMDFRGIDVILVKSAIDRASRGFPVDGIEAMAVASLIQFAETLQVTVKTAVKEDADWYNRFMPLTQVVMDLTINRPFVKSVQQVIDEDGSVKDSASSELKRYRDKVRVLERKLYQLMDKLIRNDISEASSLEVSNVNGRWCIKTMADQFTTFEGLLLSSGSGVGGLVEPIAAVPLNDELQQARESVAKAEEIVLSRLTDKLLAELDDIQSLLHTVIKLDVVIARAKYSIAYSGTFPDLSLPADKGRVFTNEANPVHKSSNKTSFSHPHVKEWKLYMPKAYHPLLLQQHHDNLHKARKDVTNATAEIRRKKLQGKNMTTEEIMDSHLASMKLKVVKLEQGHPIAVDFMVSMKTAVLVVTGPNTGGKTICLKTIGLASLMAKTGLYVLASEPVKIPWFDAIYADIGDEQSLTQSLSTFSGHLKQISAIRSNSTSQSLVLLDEVGAGTNPLEGAALGMSLLESFAETGSFLTIATTHHGELKTLKYSNYTFENACVEFDEVSLKPTYKILWGVPGRSNAISISERLGLPHFILDNARKLHGTASAEINEVIVDMERYKQASQHHLQEAHHYLMLSRKLHENLLVAKQKIRDHYIIQRSRKVKAISEVAAIARATLRSKLQQCRESAANQASQNEIADNSKNSIDNLRQLPLPNIPIERTGSGTSTSSHEKQIKIPQIGDTVHVSSLGKKAVVLKVEESKGEIIVQASNLKLRLKLNDIGTQQVRTL